MPAASSRSLPWLSAFPPESRSLTDRHDVGRKDSVQGANAVLHRLSVPVLNRRSHRHHASSGALRLAAHSFVFRRGALSLRNSGRNSVCHLRCVLLLVSENDRPDAERDPWQMAFLALPDWLPLDVRRDAHPRIARDATPDLYLRTWAWLGHVELHHHNRCFYPGDCNPCICGKPDHLVFQRSGGGQ